MLYSLPTLPLELRLRISHYLSAHEILCATSSCKTLYQLFAHEDIWNKAYRSLLQGYPDHKFVVTSLVRMTKRLDYLTFEKPLTIKWLDEWCTSWKQRTIFILHIIKIQSEVVSAIRQRTDIFGQPKDAPLFNAEFIADMESYVRADFPIDFVIYLQRFAHQVTFPTLENEIPTFVNEVPTLVNENTVDENIEDDDTDYSLDDEEMYEEIKWPLLASGYAFSDQKHWRGYIHKADFTHNELTRIYRADQPNLDCERAYRASEWQHMSKTSHYKYQYRKDVYYRRSRDAALSDSTRRYLDRMVLACFSVTYDVVSDIQTNLSLILGVDSDLEDEIPVILDTRKYKVDLESMKDGVGKVVTNTLSYVNGYELRAIAESFTDYFVQWGSVVISLGYLPDIEDNPSGYADLIHRLPRHVQCQSSILLPQCLNWSVGNYAPTYFSLEYDDMESFTTSALLEDDRNVLPKFLGSNMARAS